MVSELFSNYYNYKMKTIYQYTLILNKIISVDNNKLFTKQKTKESFWTYVINDYMKRYIEGIETNGALLKGFINNKDLTNNKLNKEAMSVVNYFIANNMVLKIKDYSNEIVLASYILKLANELDQATSPYIKNKNNYNTIVINSIEEANKIKYFQLIDDGKKNMGLLIELIKTNVRKERKIFELLTSTGSFNRYIDISKDDLYYLTQYNYRVPNLNKFDEFAIKEIYDKKGIDDEFVLISANLISVSLMKLLSARKKMKVFFLPIRISFFDNEKNIKELSILTKDKILSKYFKILINYNEFNLNIQKILNKYNANCFIYCSKGSKASDGNKLNDCKNYLISKDFYNNNQDIVSKWERDGMNIIKENFDGLVTDKNLVTE